MRQPIRDLRNQQDFPGRFCDLVIEGGCVTLEVKSKKPICRTISWEDLKYQVEAALRQQMCDLEATAICST